MGSAAFFADIDWDQVETITRGHHGFFSTPCPVCSPDRKPSHRRLKVFGLWREAEDFATYNCVHCQMKGHVFRDRLEPAPTGGVLLRAFATSRDYAAEEQERAERFAQAEAERTQKIADAEFTFFSAGDIKGTLAEEYLAGRKITPGRDMRFTAHAPRGKATAPAMVVALRDAAGVLTAIQSTFLPAPDGAEKLRLSCGSLGCGAVRLAEIGADGVLAVAEGVETALSFTALYGVPCWATLGSGGLRRFEPPPGLQRLVIAADNDESGDGMDAAHALAKRACELCEVHISAPAQLGDWNDALRGSAA